MSSTVLSVIQSALYSIGVQPPTTLISNTDPGALQIYNLLLEESRYLRNQRIFPQSKKVYTFNLKSSRSQYPLPKDFYAALPGTQFNRSNKFPLIGPLGDGDFNYRLYGTVSFENRVAYRVFGPDLNPATGSGQFQVNPTPGTTTEGQVITFDYISSSVFLPPNWVAATVTAVNDYVNSNGQVYKCTARAGDFKTGAISPNMANGVGLDGSMSWTYVPTWAATTLYFIGDYVSANGKVYLCSNSGVSSAVAPSHSSGTATDGTVYWVWQSTPDAWIVGTRYTSLDFTKVVATGYFYRGTSLAGAVTPTGGGVSGTIAPNFTNTTIVDNNVTWTWIDTSYSVPLTDSDTCLFDDDIVTLGIKWRYQKSKKLEYQEDQAEYNRLVSSAKSRWHGSFKTSLAVPMVRIPSPNVPEGNFSI